MKVEVKDKVSEIKFPCLMISEDKKFIVLFSNMNCGTCIYSNMNCGTCIYSLDSIIYEIGSYSEAWIMPLFVPFDGEITLKND